MDKLILAAILIEALWETAKMVAQNGKFSWDRTGVLVVAVAISFAVGLQLFSLIGLDMPAWVDMLGTGLLLSRGANWLHDLFGVFGGNGPKD